MRFSFYKYPFKQLLPEIIAHTNASPLRNRAINSEILPFQKGGSRYLHKPMFPGFLPPSSDPHYRKNFISAIMYAFTFCIYIGTKVAMKSCAEPELKFHCPFPHQHTCFQRQK